jgi:hypothetical protein
MGLSPKMIDLIGYHTFQNPAYPCPIAQVAIVKEQTCVGTVGVTVEMVNPVCVESTRAPDDPVDFISLLQKEFGQVGAVLACNARD